MTELTRRHALRSALGGLGTASTFLLAPAFAQAPRAYPSKPMLLTRRLVRGLADGKSIIVERSWIIEFAAQGKGLAITGKQSSVSVDAPKVLAQIAEIEEARSTNDMFPILLAPNGTLMAAGSTSSEESINSALKTAEVLFMERGFSSSSAAEQVEAMVQLQRSGAQLLDKMPGDLFYPSIVPVRKSRTVKLANGAKGEFEVSWEASVQPGSALLKDARREIITRIGTSLRKSTEVWSLSDL
ncbi:MAG: hypothetical protein AAFR64_08300 [Pseudomonadota bacterium]